MAQVFETINAFLNKYVTWLSFPSVKWTDVVEIIIISFLFYRFLAWIKDTKAWSLLKGIVIILLFVLIAALFSMTTILWIAKNIFSVAVTATVVVFQPELRKALEQLGKRKVFSGVFNFEGSKLIGERFSDDTINEIVRASYEMGKAKTGALIVLSQNDSLIDYENTGIAIDSLVSNQLLINIFEHNTPLHDGAVIVRGDRITSATCYLPLSDNMKLSKDLGTRHRAGVGISEATDSMTVIVSEETGKISVAYLGELSRNLDSESLKEKLREIQNKAGENEPTKKLFLWKGRAKNEKSSY